MTKVTNMTKVQTIKVRDTQGLDKILGKDGGQTRHQTRPRCSRSGSGLEIAKNGSTVDELPGFCELLQGVHQGLRGQSIPDATTNEAQRQEVHVEQRGGIVIPENKERVVRGTGAGDATEKGMYVLDTDASVVAISGTLHQEQEWNGKAVLRPIAYGSEVSSDTEMKYGAPKAEMFAVVIFVEKYRAYLGSEPFKLRVNNRALSWLKMYSIDQSYIGRWIVRLDGYNVIIEHRTRDKHHRTNSWIKKHMTVFHSRDGSTSQANR